MNDEFCEECGTRLYQAGENVPAGAYLRIDDGSFQPIRLVTSGVLPASLDGHVALYRAAAAPCTCQGRECTPADHTSRPAPSLMSSESAQSLQVG